MNFYNHHIRSIFKSHSISVTFKFCAVLGAQGIRATGFKRTQGNALCAKFESNTNRMTFETNTICTTSDIQALQSCVINIFSHGIIRTKGKSILNLLFTKNIGPRANNQKGIKVIGPRTNNFFLRKELSRTF